MSLDSYADGGSKMIFQTKLNPFNCKARSHPRTSCHPTAGSVWDLSPAPLHHLLGRTLGSEQVPPTLPLFPRHPFPFLPWDAKMGNTAPPSSPGPSLPAALWCRALSGARSPGSSDPAQNNVNLSKSSKYGCNGINLLTSQWREEKKKKEKKAIAGMHFRGNASQNTKYFAPAV